MTEVYLNTVQLGSGFPLLMLHGWGQTLEALRPMGELLASSARVHLIDLPGFGASALPDGDWDTERYAERILRYMDQQGLERVDLLAHSFGGRVSIRVASQYPDRVRCLTLIDSAGLQPRRSLKKRIRIAAIKWLRTLLTLTPIYGTQLREWHSQRFGSRDYLNAGPLRGTFVRTVNEDLTSNASRIQAPTLLIWGEADTETPVEMGRRLNQLISNSKLIELPRRDHVPFGNEGAHLCAYYVLQFLQEVSKTTPAHHQQLSYARSI
jgi:pimeloyl-ACP methyl ester carboxylesterase